MEDAASEDETYRWGISLVCTGSKIPTGCYDLGHLITLDLRELALRNPVSIDDQPFRLVLPSVLVEFHQQARDRSMEILMAIHSFKLGHLSKGSPDSCCGNDTTTLHE